MTTGGAISQPTGSFQQRTRVSYQPRHARQGLPRRGDKSRYHQESHPAFLEACIRARLLEQGTDIWVIQELLGHSHLQTTLVYTHVSNVMFRDVVSPLDQLGEE